MFACKQCDGVTRTRGQPTTSTQTSLYRQNLPPLPHYPPIPTDETLSASCSRCPTEYCHDCDKVYFCSRCEQV